MNPETKAILDALLESRRILEAKLEAVEIKLGAVETKLGAVASDVTAIKEQLADMSARDQYLMHTSVWVTRPRRSLMPRRTGGAGSRQPGCWSGSVVW